MKRFHDVWSYLEKEVGYKVVQMEVSMEDKSTLRRVQIDLGTKSLEDLDFLKVTTESTSYVGVIKRAIRVLRALLTLLDQGGAIFVRMPNGEEKKILIL